MTCYLDIHCQLCSSPSVCNSGSPLEVDRQRHAHTHTHTHIHNVCTVPGEIPCCWGLCVLLWPLAWSIRWGKSVWGVGLNVKGKRCRRREVETCNIPTHTGWSQSRGGGTPILSLCLSPKHNTDINIKISHLMFLSTGLKLFVHAANCEKPKWHKRKASLI